MSYKLLVKKSAVKEIESLPSKLLPAITKAIYALADNPRPVGCKKLKGSRENI